METIKDQYEMTMKESPIKTAIIKLKQDKYKGFEFYYGNVSMPDDLSEDSGNVELSYDFYVHSNPNDIELLTDEFEKLLGDIIVDIVLSEQEYDRTDDTEPSD